MRHLALVISVFSTLIWADPIQNWESVYTKATLSFRENRFNEALSLIQQILDSNPTQTEALELKALIFKAQSKSKETREIYLKLIELAKQTQKTKNVGLYSFELGKIAFDQGNLTDAKNYLTEAVNRGKNPEASHFLLGKIYWTENNLPESREHFEACLKSKSFGTLSAYYIAESYRRENRLSDAIDAYSKARNLANTAVEEDSFSTVEAKNIASDVLKNSQAELENLTKNHRHWLKEIGLTSSYDSNVLFFPNGSDGGNIASQGSFKQTVNWKLKYGTSMLERLRYLGSYEGAINFNANRTTEPGQFFINDLSNYFILGSTEKLQYGAKIGGTGILNYQATAFKPFILMGTLGPFFKANLSKNWAWGLETFFQPVKFYQDYLLNNSAKRSGWELMIRTYLSNNQKTRYWNPSLFLTGNILRPQGSEFRGTRINLDFANAMYLTPSLFFAESAGLLGSTYADRNSGRRTDQGVSAMLGVGYELSSSLLLFAQMDYRKNFSSDPNFRFDRWSTNLSGNYRF